MTQTVIYDIIQKNHKLKIHCINSKIIGKKIIIQGSTHVRELIIL